MENIKKRNWQTASILASGHQKRDRIDVAETLGLQKTVLRKKWTLYYKKKNKPLLELIYTLVKVLRRVQNV